MKIKFGIICILIFSFFRLTFAQNQVASNDVAKITPILYLLLSDQGNELGPLITCDDDPTVDESCAQGSQGRRSDDGREKPLKPSLLRDLHLVEVSDYPRANIDTNIESFGYFTRPHIPPYRTTTDGRVAMQARTRNENPNAGVFYFYLFEPKKIAGSFLSSKVTEDDEDNGMSILSSRSPWILNRSDFIDTDAPGSSMHSAICNDPSKPVRTCGTNDCYDFTVIAPYNNTNDDTIEIWGTEVTVEITDPKTANSSIVDVRTATPRKGAVWPNQDRFLETMITIDGRLMVGRVSGRDITFIGANGESITGHYDSAYSAYSPNLPACDPAHFQSPLPISHMPYDDVIKANWEVGRYPWTYPDGSIIPDGVVLRATYPWLDSKGKNIFFGSSTSHEPLHQNDVGYDGVYDIDCLDVINEDDCVRVNTTQDDTDSDPDNGDSTRSLTVIGLWTQGRAVLMDNLLNNIDWGIRANPSWQRLVKLYHGHDGWVRVGSGRDNKSDIGRTNILGSSGNINFIDSIESKFNHDENLKLNIPADVAWLMSNGTVTDVVSFDDWVNPYGLISSSMVQAKSGSRFTPDFTRVQNSVSGRFETPAYGQIVNNGSVERVALGGVRGKGLFLRPSSGLQYQIPVDQPTSFNNETWYLGLFIDPRNKNDNFYRRLIEFPNGTAIDIQGLHSISLVNVDGNRVDKRFNASLPFAKFSHLGFRISANGQSIEVFLDGMEIFTWHNLLVGNIKPVSPGDLVIGRNSSDSDPRVGFHGWIDEVKLVANADQLNPEELCNKAMGSIVSLSAGSGFIKVAQNYPSSTHQSIKVASSSSENWFRCHTDFENNDGWVDLNNLPNTMTSLRENILFPEGPLLYNQPRPDSTRNGFCLSCHASDNSGIRPISLLPSSLTFNGVLMQNDERRQPSQPPARVHGNIPAQTWGSFPANNVQTNQNGRSIDQFISR